MNRIHSVMENNVNFQISMYALYEFYLVDHNWRLTE